MQFGLVDGQRQEARPNLSAKCPACGHAMVAKCGEVRIWHWAHQNTLHCDPWWENETEWHRNWKGHFPLSWQESVYRAESGEKHVADVRTDQDWVIEFQHSHITPEERRSRDLFYRKLVWVVDATRRKTDGAGFRKAWEVGAFVQGSAHIRRVRLDDCRLLREWSNTPAPIFFDFGNGPTIWWLLARCPDEPAYVAPFARSDFIAIHHAKGPEGARDFDEFTKTINELVSKYNAHLRCMALKQTSSKATGFQQYLARRRIRTRL
jgi:competence protein CoiA